MQSISCQELLIRRPAGFPEQAVRQASLVVRAATHYQVEGHFRAAAHSLVRNSVLANLQGRQAGVIRFRMRHPLVEHSPQQDQLSALGP